MADFFNSIERPSEDEVNEARQWAFFHLGVAPQGEVTDQSVYEAFMETGLTEEEAIEADAAWVILCSGTATPSFLMLEDMIGGLKKRRVLGEEVAEETADEGAVGPPCHVCGERLFVWGEVKTNSPMILEAVGGYSYPVKARLCQNCGNVQLFAQEPEDAA